MAKRERFVVDLTNPKDLTKLTRLVGEEAAPLYRLDNKIRERFTTNGQTISIEEARQYQTLLRRMDRNTSILIRLINQAGGQRK